MRRLWTTMCAVLAAVSAAPDARATDVRLETGALAAGTDWRGDVASYGHLKLGFRFIDTVGVYGQGHVGYGAVDQRMLTLLALGVQAWTPALGPVRIYGRLAALHQHEESLSVVAGDFGSAILGVGDGIRHRAGIEPGIGFDASLYEKKDFELVGAVDASAKIFPDDLGPLVYAGGGVNLGFNYAL